MARGRTATFALAVWLCASYGASHAQTAADPAALIEQGRYVAVAGDCAGCHTAPGGGKAFAGGYGIASPLGVIFSSNITPSTTAGIGGYTEAQFARALRQGVRANGQHLYPAMPYTSYAGITDADMRALYAYFMHAVAPVDEPAPPTALPFPFNIRMSMVAWNLLFLSDRRFAPDSTRSPAWNRGAYLTEVLEHCSVCHTPRDLLMGEIAGRAYAGAALGSWYAPNITSDPVSGIGGWSEAELVQYLATGAVPGRGQAAGGMAEAVQHSLQYLTRDDLAAIAGYVKSIPPIRDPGETRPAFANGQPAGFETSLRGRARQTSNGTIQGGEALFSGYCASCHQPTGGGTPDQSYPALWHNAVTGGVSANNMIAAILFGVDRSVGDRHVLMPRFDDASFVQALSDEQIAAIGTYVARQFGNSGLRVTAADVAMIRAGGAASPLALVSTYAVPGLAIAALVVVALIGLLVVWRRRSRLLPPQV